MEQTLPRPRSIFVALGTYSEGEMDSAEMKATASSEGMKAVQSAIRLFVMMICIGYTMEKAKKVNPKVIKGSNFGRWEAKLESSALMLGLVGNICLAFLFFPISRGSSVLQLTGLTSEASVKYHIRLGHIVMTLFTHGLGYILFWAETHQISQMLKWNKIGISNVAGEVALLSGLVMWATTFTPLRRKIFEIFFYTHHLYIIFVVFFLLHVEFSYSCIMLPGLYLFLIDRYLRFLQSQQRVRFVSARVLPCHVVELNFSKSPELSHTPTSTMFINVPSISKLQWHPFTITSSSNMDLDHLSVVIKCNGSQSQKLYQKLSSPSPMDRIEVSIEGPYGPLSTQFLRHDMLVMVSGGSGITPFISVIRELLFRSNTTGGKTPRVLLICAFKKSSDLTMLDLFLPLSDTNLDSSRLQLQTEAYVTGEKEHATHNQKLLQTIWFKPNSLDAPISAVLGTNNWLWLGAIISASFIIFLLLIGIVTRCYIYPIDRNSDKIFSYTLRSALNMLFICVSIAVTATAAFLCNKKQNDKELKQIQNVDMPTPMTSPSSWFHNVDKELDILSSQSFVQIQTTKIHLGERPNLKKMLMGCEGSSIGVLASGPKRLRHNVAAICSSGLANNLHFDSISFSW
ncbi:ferric reduction oxidase 2-like [Quercus robur]|uniref:ferric reduction oxidase 2-like n=1 Tax=Quercus robur TaxID=38942 RepID=UPI0021617989|nr:ferric reduction oxidase 2-like [Quercus robur]